MRSFFIFLVLGLAAISALASPERIVGGAIVGEISSYPMAAAMLFSITGAGTFRQICGGSIINNRSILSAAHCYIHPAIRWRARVGSTSAHSGGAIHIIGRIINHLHYNPRTVDNDISILHTTHTFLFNNNVWPGIIAGPHYNLGDNEIVWVIGWGRTSFGGPWSEDLRHVQIWTVNQDICRQRHAEFRFTITDNMLCSGWLDIGGRDHCQGDFGGPLLHNNVIVGISSWGHECGHPRFPGVNTRVSRFTAWILNNV